MTVKRHLHALGKIYKCRGSILRRLFTDNLAQRTSICASLLSQERYASFLEQTITENEK